MPVKLTGYLPSSSSGTNISNTSSNSKLVKKLTQQSTSDNDFATSIISKKMEQSSEESITPPNMINFSTNTSSIYETLEGNYTDNNCSSSNISEDQSSIYEPKSGKENKLNGKLKKVKKSIRSIKIFKNNKT
ncbi:Hypothetical protein SRAE_2000193700 [Strongyloides ratti]|uniref:Uncharacterized protein n=1 Tax=Strongyloides ratti TaxID=34506 RepID=A0A090LGN3_STRRB|nr:Hypothetical protein SRAE_2000193700 [Strongyloides ratti]CEF67273.1 Hypothetical protein SRAE_2000193700 [Strongyloides ratti]